MTFIQNLKSRIRKFFTFEGFRLSKVIVVYSVVGLVVGFLYFSPYHIARVATYSIDANVIIWKKGLPQKDDFFLFDWLADNELNGLGPEKGSLFSKRLFCGPGDFLDTTGDQIFCNGNPGRLVAYEMGKKKVKVKPFRYKGIIPNGKYFAVGDIQDSYDSLYWGFVDESWIKGRSVLWL